MRTITQIPLNSETGISAVVGEEALCRRLREMGFHPGCRVKLLGRAPFWGAYILQLHDSVLALRPSEAQCLMIQDL